MKIGILTFDNFTDIDLFLNWDLLNRVKLFNLYTNWEVQIIGTNDHHNSVSGLKVKTHGHLPELANCDAILFTSGPGTRDLIVNTDYLDQLNFAPNCLLAAQCSGSLILGTLGLLNQKKVSAYPPIANLLKEFNSKLVHESLVIDGRLATASSCMGSLLLSGWIIESLVGNSIKQKIYDSVMPLSGFDSIEKYM